MKLTKETLKRIIKEELDATLNESGPHENPLIGYGGWENMLITPRFIKRGTMSVGAPDLLASALKQSLNGQHWKKPADAAQELLDFVQTNPDHPQLPSNEKARAQLIEFLEWAKTQ